MILKLKLVNRRLLYFILFVNMVSDIVCVGVCVYVSVIISPFHLNIGSAWQVRDYACVPANNSICMSSPTQTPLSYFIVCHVVFFQAFVFFSFALCTHRDPVMYIPLITKVSIFWTPPSNLAYKAIITHYKNYKKYYMRRGQCGCSIPKKEAWAR